MNRATRHQPSLLKREAEGHGGRQSGVPPRRPLRICIDARMKDGEHGGVQQAVIGLATGLAEIDEGTEDYLFLVPERLPDWLRPHLRGPCRPLEMRHAERQPKWKRAVKALFPERFLTEAYRRVKDRLPIAIPASDGTIERAGVHVMHQTVQAGFRTDIPRIYMPYDLQHLHLPEMFTRRERRWRDVTYQTLCREAQAVVAISRWGREDLIRSYQLEPKKVAWVHLAPAVDAYEPISAGELAAAKARLTLPEVFAYYPAQTWKHKNHLGLFEALARLRDRDGLRVPLVSSGLRNDHFPVLERRARELGLSEQVRFLGFVSPAEVQALYALCRMLVFASRFEGFGMPVVEAFRLGVPVACSSATSLPEVAGDAALLFDPESPDAIADAVRRLWTEPSLRAELVARGRERARAFTWKETAKRFRALYRFVGGGPLGAADRAQLAGAS